MHRASSKISKHMLDWNGEISVSEPLLFDNLYQSVLFKPIGGFHSLVIQQTAVIQIVPRIIKQLDMLEFLAVLPDTYTGRSGKRCFSLPKEKS